MNRSTAFRRLAIRLSAGTLLVISVTGCAVDQNKEVAIYRRELDATAPKPQPYDGQRAITLVDALSLANQSNEQLAISGEDYLQALINKHRAVANFLPTISFQPTFALEQEQNTVAPANSTGTSTGGTGSGTGAVIATGNSALITRGFRRLKGDTLYAFQAPVVGNMNLFRGGGDLATLKSTEFTIEQRRQLLLDAQATVLLNVAQTYYAVLRSEKAVEVLSNTLNVQQERLRDVQQQFANGLATNLSVSQTRAQVDATRVTLVQAQGDVRNGRHTLAFLIGSDQVTGQLVDDFSTPTSVTDMAAFERDAVQTRQDLLAAIAAVKAAKENVTAAISQYYPSVSLNVEGFLYREYFADASKWSALLSVNLPIFSAGRIEADVREAWSRLRQAALQESYLRRQALNDVRTAFQNVETADQRVLGLRDEVSAANDAYRQSQDAFNNNLAINLDVLTAQDQLLSSQLDLAGAQYDRTVYYLDLLRSSGRLTVNQIIATLAATGPSTKPVPASQPLP